MTDDEYIRSRRYGLLYIYNKNSILLSHASVIFCDDNDKSVVLAARGSSINFKENSPIVPAIELENPVHGDGGYLSGTIESMKLYSWMCASRVSQVKNLLRTNPKQVDLIKQRFKRINCQSCKCIIALLDLTGVANDSVDEVDYLTFIKLKVGGTELISEFLLSKFIYEWEDEFEYDELEPIGEDFRRQTYGDDSSLSRMLYKKTGDESVVVGECSPIFKLETFTSLAHLTKNKFVLDCDDFESWPVEEGAYFYFNVDIKNKQKLDDKYVIPRRVYEILEKHQLEYLEKTTSSVIEDDLVFVYKSLLRQQTPPSESTRRHLPLDTWGSEMYSILGGDGDGDVYLGDGMALDANGRLVDD
jgi:hypothetical protein